jgi:hypothetical protein
MTILNVTINIISSLDERASNIKMYVDVTFHREVVEQDSQIQLFHDMHRMKNT